MTQIERQQELQELFEALRSQNPLDRILAIRILGDIGDEASLDLLRAYLAEVSKEYDALITAIRNLRTRLGAQVQIANTGNTCCSGL